MKTWTQENADTGTGKPERDGATARVPRGAQELLISSASLQLCSLHRTFDLFPSDKALPRWLSGFRFPLSAFVLLLLLPLCAYATSDPSLLPDSRQMLSLPASERNPFVQQIAPEAAPAAAQEGTTEEARLRRIFRAMKIGAVSGNSGSKQVLLGSLIIKPGRTLPPILKNQFEVLRVLSVDDTSVVLAFVERDRSANARQIILPYGIKPEVTQVMFGEAFEKLTQVGPNGKIDAPPLTMQGVEEFLNGSREADLRNMADREVQMMGVVTNAEKPTKEK